MASDRPLIRRVYLDHAATSPLRSEARDAMEPYLVERFGNPSSLHQEGRMAREALEAARELIRRACGANGFDLIFTSGGTEANNAALLGTILAERERDPASRRTCVALSALEHPSLLEVAPVAQALGAEWQVLGATADGRVDLERLRTLVGDRALVLSLQWANNETGSLQPLEEAVRIARDRGALVHTDCVQALGKVPVDLDAAGVDLATISAHKLGGPKGIAALLVRRGAPFRALLRGGGQEAGARAGTENVALAVAFACAVERSVAERTDLMPKLQRGRDELRRRLVERWPRAVLNTPGTGSLPTILNVSFPWVEGEALVRLLDRHGVAASTGSACNAGAHKPSHVLRAMGRSDREVRGSLRFSFGRTNTIEDVVPVLEALERALGQLESLSPAS